MHWFADLLQSHNGLLFFIILGFGYLVGKVGVKGFSLGPVAGVLFVGIVFGHYGYRFGPSAQAVGFFFIFAVPLLGALTGAMTSGASLSVVLKEADSPLPALGYAGTYAIANILLVFAGSLIFLFS
ncbi:hypothetical protein [Hydrogenimonas sp.]|uniref:aspartate-alanine antiporter-like transporter n=1 Tax=Hydrogenimonas sp. TaxID=2231112 RepID=UPI002612866C|nr:hypothetical protein [Hydrogenimonas sp.]